MVSISNSISYNSYPVNANVSDVKKLVKYTKNQPVAQDGDSFSGTAQSAVSSMALFEGIPLLNLFVRNKKTSGKLINENMKKLGELNKNASAQIKSQNVSKWQKFKDYASYTTSSSEVYGNIKNVTKSEAEIAKLSKKLAKTTEKTAKNPSSKSAQKSAEKIMKKLESAKKSLATSNDKLSESFNNAASKATNSAAKATTGKLAGFRNFMKSSGATVMLVFSGISELASEVIPTFKELGAKSGIKQTGKSAVKVVGDTAGYLAGAKAGTVLGTKIGTAIAPGIGSAIGAAVGFVGGLLGSFVAGKVTTAIVGKSEREIAADKQNDIDTAKIVNDEQMFEELKAEVTAKINEEQANGSLSKDSILALAALENLDNSNPFAIAV